MDKTVMFGLAFNVIVIILGDIFWIFLILFMYVVFIINPKHSVAESLTIHNRDYNYRLHRGERGL